MFVCFRHPARVLVDRSVSVPYDDDKDTLRLIMLDQDRIKENID